MHMGELTPCWHCLSDSGPGRRLTFSARVLFQCRSEIKETADRAMSLARAVNTGYPVFPVAILHRCDLKNVGSIRSVLHSPGASFKTPQPHQFAAHKSRLHISDENEEHLVESRFIQVTKADPFPVTPAIGSSRKSTKTASARTLSLASIQSVIPCQAPAALGGMSRSISADGTW
jgi:hypothetical protein